MTTWRVRCVFCGWASGEAADEWTGHRLRAAHMRQCDALIEIGGASIMIVRVDEDGEESVLDHSTGAWIGTRFEVVNERRTRR